jgi:transcriptional regulator with XRE-family HTH domain
MRNDLGRILYARNLREHDLARRAGLAQSHLNRIKNRRVVPSLETALRICAALGLPVEAVFSLDADPGAPRHATARRHASGTRRGQPGTSTR